VPPPAKASPSLNGVHAPERIVLPNRLAARAALAAEGTDEVEIGSDPPATDADAPAVEPARAATMADAAKLVSSVKFLVRDWVPFGMVTGVVAEPGHGKSAFALWLARTVLTGAVWFTGTKGPRKPGDVLWCGTENDVAITLDRVGKWKLPPERLLLPFDDDPLRTVTLTNVGDLERIEALIGTYKTKLVVIDSLRGGHDSDENSSQVGRVLQSLAAVAERTRAALVVVHHSRKLSPDEDVSANSSRGSNAIFAYFRSMIGIDRPDPDGPWSRVRMLKQNLGLAPKPIGFRVTDTGLEFGPAPVRPEKETEKGKAADWLRERLRSGEAHNANEVIEEAKQLGFTERTVRRAATAELGVKPQQIRADGKIVGWTWALPSPTVLGAGVFPVP
jgi:hypothetical protein